MGENIVQERFLRKLKTHWQTWAEHSDSPGTPSIGDSPEAKHTPSFEFKSSVESKTAP